MVNVSAYGQYGPNRDRIGFDPIGQAISGMMSLTGFPGTPPTRTYNPVIDRITALHGTIGTLAALRERELSGEGQCIDVCLADTGFSMTEIQCAAYLGAGSVPERSGNGQGLTNTYATQDGWVLIAAMSDNIWPRLCEAIAAPEWVSDPRFQTLAGRSAQWQVLEERLQGWFATQTVHSAVATFSRLGIPINAVNDVATAAHEPQLHERELLVEVQDPTAGTIHVSGKFIKLSRSETVVGSAPVPGQHTEELLTSVLHYTPEEIDKLEAEGAVYRSIAQ
jgi:formyl-CoA transferase